MYIGYMYIVHLFYRRTCVHVSMLTKHICKVYVYVQFDQSIHQEPISYVYICMYIVSVQTLRLFPSKGREPLTSV